MAKEAHTSHYGTSHPGECLCACQDPFGTIALLLIQTSAFTGLARENFGFFRCQYAHLAARMRLLRVNPDAELRSIASRTTLRGARKAPKYINLKDEGSRRWAGADTVLLARSQKLGPKGLVLGEMLSLIPEPPFDDKILRAAIYRYADSIIAGNDRYSAVTSVLKRELPRIRGHKSGDSIVMTGADSIASAVTAIAGLDRSHLLCRGPRRRQDILIRYRDRKPLGIRAAGRSRGQLA